MYWVDGQAARPGDGDPKAGWGVDAAATSIREQKYWPSAGGLNDMRSEVVERGCMVYRSGKTYIPKTAGRSSSAHSLFVWMPMAWRGNLILYNRLLHLETVMAAVPPWK